MNGGNVIFIDDDATLRRANCQSLMLAGFCVETFADAEAALAVITPEFDGVVVSDIRMPGIDGLGLFKAVQAIDFDIPVILITGHGDVPLAVSSLKAGAHDFLTKPYAADHLVASIRRAMQLRSLLLDKQRLRRSADLAIQQSPLVGTSPAIAQVREAIGRIVAADIDVDVLIEGEAGTGKDLVARLVHAAGRRRSRPFVSVNCASGPPEIIEAELFGDTRSGSIRDTRTSSVEAAHQGTLYLDNIGALSSSAQARLVTVLDGGPISFRSTSSSRPVALRVIASSRTRLQDAVERQSFREDLFYRLATASVWLPPLRDRGSDLISLFALFVHETRPGVADPWRDLDQAFRQHLQDHQWPGNAHELRMFARRVALDLPNPAENKTPVVSLTERVRRFEEKEIVEILSFYRGDVATAADILQIPRKTLYDKINRHGIHPEEYR